VTADEAALKTLVKQVKLALINNKTDKPSEV
jgi:predicted GIY-YIG superfamily endonuclease